MIRALLLSFAAIAAYRLQQSHTLLPLLSLLLLLSVWVLSEIARFFVELYPATPAKEAHRNDPTSDETWR